jgi:hypothetical protein
MSSDAPYTDLPPRRVHTSWTPYTLHGLLLVFGLLGGMTSAIVVVQDFVTVLEAAWVVVVAGLVVTAAHVLVVWRCPIPPPRRRPKPRSEGDLPAGAPEPPLGFIPARAFSPPEPVRPKPWRPVLLLGVPVALLLVPVAMCLVMGWPINAGCYPPVAGPGDLVRVYPGLRIHSILGLWHGTTNLRLLNAAELDVPEDAVRARPGRAATWEKEISTSSSTKTEGVNPWVVLEIPTDDGLIGKTLDLEVRLRVRYPDNVGSKRFWDYTQEGKGDYRITLARPYAGVTLVLVWWFCFLASAGTYLWAATRLAGRSR